MSSKKPSCFVIMPFSVRDHDLEKYNGDVNHWNEVYEGLIEPAVEAAGMYAIRDDNDLSSRLVAEGIWRKIEDSSVVLCDLSSFNPNVYLELGWALRADKKFVLIKDEQTDFSFDLNQLHTCNYNSMLRPISLKSDIKKLSKTISDTDADKERQYSLVKRLALTTAIELDAGSDKQADMLELIYNKLSELPSTNRSTPTGTIKKKSSEKEKSEFKNALDAEKIFYEESVKIKKAEQLLEEMNPKSQETAWNLASSSALKLVRLLNESTLNGKRLSDAISLHERAQAVLSKS